MKKRHVIFRTTADVERTQALLRGQTAEGPAGADSLVGVLSDTVRTDPRPFRGEVEGGRFKLTRRVRGRRVRVQLEGRLEGKPDGTTEIHASMAPPRTLTLGLYGGTAAGLLVALVLAAGGALAPAAFLAAALVLGVFLGQRLFDREASSSFRALRDAVPENAGALAPVVEGLAESKPAPTDERVADRARRG
ncbi:MAG: hypothetical protein AB1938_18110 [Myxococcota bacterium]